MANTFHSNIENLLTVNRQRAGSFGESVNISVFKSLGCFKNKQVNIKTNKQKTIS